MESGDARRDLKHATVPCQWCKLPTPMLGTRECDRCHELRIRIQYNVPLAQRMLDELTKGES